MQSYRLEAVNPVDFPGPAVFYLPPDRSAAIEAEPMATNYFFVALGGALGSVSRFWLSGVAARHFGETFPWGTLIVNVTGSFAIGFFAALTAPDGRWFVSPGLRNFFMAGLLGGYTTFSSFSLQTLNLAENGEYGRATGNALASMAGCLVAVWLGHVLAQSLNTLKDH
jgi:CrcB protein